MLQFNPGKNSETKTELGASHNFQMSRLNIFVVLVTVTALT
jgi:hypothetical protein